MSGLSGWPQGRLRPQLAKALPQEAQEAQEEQAQEARLLAQVPRREITAKGLVVNPRSP
jgi:hypothetical protein